LESGGELKLKQAFEMMADFYGFRVIDSFTGELEVSRQSPSRVMNLEQYVFSLELFWTIIFDFANASVLFLLAIPITIRGSHAF
jgi:hypothetical protein